MKEKNPSESHGHLPIPLAVQDGKVSKKRARAAVAEEVVEKEPKEKEHIFHSKPQPKKSKKAEPVPLPLPLPQEVIEEEEVEQKPVPNNGERLNAILRERRDAQFQNIKEALTCYQKEHGHVRMSRQYRIPQGSTFYPERLWGMQLGNRFRDIKRGTKFMTLFLIEMDSLSMQSYHFEFFFFLFHSSFVFVSFLSFVSFIHHIICSSSLDFLRYLFQTSHTRIGRSRFRLQYPSGAQAYCSSTISF